MSDGDATLALRLAGPLQSWGTRSEFNRRETDLLPSKSGVIGLLAAAQGRPRDADITDLVGLRLGVRVDSAGSILRDFHTVSDYRGELLLSAAVDKSGRQKPNTAKKYTAVTERMYLQDAVFLAAIQGPRDLIGSLAQAVRRPVFPLALGRRACVPVQPLVVPHDGTDLWLLDIDGVLTNAPWQVSVAMRRRLMPPSSRTPTRLLPTTVEVPNGTAGAAVTSDVPVSFDPRARGFRTRTVRHGWVEVSTGFAASAPGAAHNPIELLGEK